MSSAFGWGLERSMTIAEGFDRSSDKDFIRFLFIAQGSCSEVKSMIYLAFRLGFISKTKKFEFLHKCAEVSRLTWGLIHKLQKMNK